MKLILTEEQSFLKETAKNFVSEKTPVDHFRKLRDNKDLLGWDKEIWSQMVALGWSGILVPEEFGGSNFGICLLYTSPSPRDGLLSRMPSSA